jgi:hypothetical protein
VPWNVQTGAVADIVVCEIIVSVPVPPVICAVPIGGLTVIVMGTGSVHVIVGFAACPVPLAVIVMRQVWPYPATALTVAVFPHPAEIANCEAAHGALRSA